jgi:hypothetical protein
MSICGGNFSFFSAFGQSYEFCFSFNDIDCLVSKLNFPSVILNTYYNHPTIFSLPTTSYLDCLQNCKCNDQDMSSIDANKCALKPNANATQKY